MKFLHPEFLWASLLITIPVIIHLFNFRKYKTVYFSRVKFLKEVTEDSRSGLKLKHLLVLISRILAILFLVFAFAQPFIPNSNQNSLENASIIYLDNSYSMEAVGTDGNLLNESKNKSIELVKSFESNEKIALFTADLNSSEFRFYSKNDVLDKIKKIDFSPKSSQLTTVLNNMSDFVKQQEENVNPRIFIFSDFQKSTSSLKELNKEEIPAFFYQPISQQKENIYIDSVWFESPVHRLNTPSDVYFRIQNASPNAQTDLTVTLEIEGNQPAPKRISIEPMSFTVGSINFSDTKPGQKKGKITVKTNQLYFDDTYYFTYQIKEEVKILLVKNSADDASNLQQLYSLDPYYKCETTTIQNVSQESFLNKELIVVQNVDKIPGGISDQLNEAMKRGATVVLIAGRNPDMNNLNDFLQVNKFPTLSNGTFSGELAFFNSEDPIYYGVFESEPKNFKYPQVSKAYRMNVTGSQNFITLFGFSAMQPFLIYGQTNNGKLALMTSPLDINFSTFQNHALFAATFLRFAETATFQTPLQMTIGKMDNFPITSAIDEKNPIHLVNKEFNIDVIPQQLTGTNSRMVSFTQIQNDLKNAGFYDVTDNNDYNSLLALNYSREESNTETYTQEELIKEFENAGWKNIKEISTNSSGGIELSSLKAKEFWKWCLLLALLFLAVEILLLKFWKT